MLAVSKRMAPGDALTAAMLFYGAASLGHFAHNAVYIAEYPNLPAWLSAAVVWIAWFGITSIGLAGYVLMRFGYPLVGMALAALWAGLGFDGLAHYSRAPFVDHTWAMNLTIWVEVIAAAVLMAVLGARFVRQLQHREASSTLRWR